MSEYLDFITVDFWHIVISMGNLLILTVIVKKFLFNPVNNILNARKKEVDDFYESAKKALSSAEKEKLSYKEKINNAHSEANDIINTAIEQANTISKSMLDDTNKKISSLMKKTEENIKIKRNKAIIEMKNDISNTVIELAEKVVKREITTEVHSDLIDKAINNLYER